MEGSTIRLRPRELKLAELRQIWQEPVRLELADSAWVAVDAAHKTIADTVAEGTVTYGVNTGFGRLAQERIDDDRLSELQRNLLLSHAAGVGEPLPDAVVRLALVLKINSLAQGSSGVRREVIRFLLRLLEKGLYPVIPAQGSVGASGDLAPLAHLALPLIGEGALRREGRVVSSAEILEQEGWSPLVLEAKEGLALLNGTQISTALGLHGLFQGERATNAALVAGALSVEAALGSRVPFDPRIQELRGQEGQIAVAALYRDLLGQSEIGGSHETCDRVQDPYSLRCQPQVMGACLDQLRFAAGILEREANAVSDNPLVFPEDGVILSGGNFHAEPVAFAADNLALAISEVGALSERRIALLIDASLSHLPPFLVAEPGLNSGFMIAHVTAAALASENKSLAHPASVDSLPTSANQEDHVSMATFGARRLGAMNANTRNIVAIELLAAAQGIDFRRPLTTSDVLEEAHAKIRAVVEVWQEDRFLAPDIEAVARLVEDGTFGNRIREFVERS